MFEVRLLGVSAPEAKTFWGFLFVSALSLALCVCVCVCFFSLMRCGQLVEWFR